MKKAPNTVKLGVPRYDPIVELQNWIGKTIRRDEPILFADDAKCLFPVGSEVVLVSIDRQSMIVMSKGKITALSLHFWADGRWELVG